MTIPRAGLRAVVLTLLALGTGCSVNEVMNQGLKEGRESGLVTNTIVNRVPMGLERAWIYEIDGERVYAMVAKEPGRKKADALLETHEKYIDIHKVVAKVAVKRL